MEVSFNAFLCSSQLTSHIPVVPHPVLLLPAANHPSLPAMPAAWDQANYLHNNCVNLSRHEQMGTQASCINTSAQLISALHDAYHNQIQSSLCKLSDFVEQIKYLFPVQRLLLSSTHSLSDLVQAVFLCMVGYRYSCVYYCRICESTAVLQGQLYEHNDRVNARTNAVLASTHRPSRLSWLWWTKTHLQQEIRGQNNNIGAQPWPLQVQRIACQHTPCFSAGTADANITL